MKMELGVEKTGSSSKKKRIGDRNNSQSSLLDQDHRNVNQTQQHLRPDGSPGMTMQEAALFSSGNSPRNRHVADAGHYQHETGSRQSRGSRAGSAASKQSRNSHQYGH